jgi:zinc transporter
MRLEDEIDALEEGIVGRQNLELRTVLTRLRRQSIALRRSIAPQRGVLRALASEPCTWLTGDDRTELREIATRLIGYIQDLDAMRERMVVIDGELTARQNDQMNRSIYRLTLVTVIFLPLTFLTGLLGANVGGIPGGQTEWGFLLFCAVLLFVLLFELILLHGMRWL